MKVLTIVIFLTPLFWLHADVLRVESDANPFVIGLAAQRALEIHDFKFESSIADSSINIASEPFDLTRGQKDEYAESPPDADVSGQVTVTIRTRSGGAAAFSLEFTPRQRTSGVTWTEIKSRGALERELVDEIKDLIERYRKTPSLN